VKALFGRSRLVIFTTFLGRIFTVVFKITVEHSGADPPWYFDVVTALFNAVTVLFDVVTVLF
jgi:hypothetical protein